MRCKDTKSSYVIFKKQMANQVHFYFVLQSIFMRPSNRAKKNSTFYSLLANLFAIEVSITQKGLSYYSDLTFVIQNFDRKVIDREKEYNWVNWIDAFYYSLNFGVQVKI